MARRYPFVCFTVLVSLAACRDNPHKEFEAQREVADSLLLGRISASVIDRAVLYKFPKNVYGLPYWMNDFVGFPQYEFTEVQAKGLVESFRGVAPFYELDRLAFERLSRDKAEPETRGLAARVAASEEFEAALASIRRTANHGYVIVRLHDGRSGYFEIWIDENLTLFRAPYYRSSLERALHWSTPSLKAAFDGAELKPIPIWYPEKSSEEANRIFDGKFPGSHRKARTFVSTSSDVYPTLGELKEIRPAKGQNYENTWIGYSATFTFRVVGSRARGAIAVRVEGNSFRGELICKGQLTKLTAQ